MRVGSDDDVELFNTEQKRMDTAAVLISKAGRWNASVEGESNEQTPQRR